MAPEPLPSALLICSALDVAARQRAVSGTAAAAAAAAVAAAAAAAASRRRPACRHERSVDRARLGGLLRRGGEGAVVSAGMQGAGGSIAIACGEEGNLGLSNEIKGNQGISKEIEGVKRLVRGERHAARHV